MNNSTNPTLIPGFCSLTKQEAFDISAKHLLNTRRPALDRSNVCTYEGTGCAAAPFIKEEERTHARGSWPIVAANEEHLLQFITALQLAHDTEVRDGNDLRLRDDQWFWNWKGNMKMIAAAAGLSMKVFDDAGEVW